MKVLLTGGTGFIGSHLAKLHVSRGDEVHIIDNLFKTQGTEDAWLKELFEMPKVHFHKLDLTQPIVDKLKVPELDIVYHLAAINGTRLFYEIPYQLARTNLLLTLNLLDALEKRKVGKLVYTSTSEVYADSDAVGLLKIPTNEETPVVFTQPTNDRFSYGTSKFMGEFLCSRFGRHFKIPTSVVRYHNIYGPAMGTKHVISEFILRVQQGENPFKIYGGDETRAFCYVSDAAEATRLVAMTPACDGEIVHIGKSDEEIKIGELAQIVMDLMKKKAPIVEQGRRAASVSRRCPDTSKLQRLTGFKANISLREGVQKTIDWYLKS